MENFTETETLDSKKFFDFYENFIDNHRDTLKYHLSECAVLDWFGKTVKGSRNICAFMCSKAVSCTHHFTNVKPASKIGFRDTHVVNITSNVGSKIPEQQAINDRTPPNPTTSAIEQGQGDGMHNCLESSPVKKSRVEDEQLPVKYVIAEGVLEFKGKISKKLQRETRWSRPCKLQIAYTQTGFEDCTIHLIIYEGNMKCRRNLMKDFETNANE